MSAPAPPKRVVIVDDSRTIRSLLRATLEADPRLDVVGEAEDPYQARAVIKAQDPDVITLDVEMPRMNGLVFLEHLMRLRPIPVVMVSGRTPDHSAEAIRALALGAVDCVDVAALKASPEQRSRLADALFCAASAQVRVRGGTRPRPADPATTTKSLHWNGRIVLIGSSTGGVDALEAVLASFPADCPPTIIAQHMPAPFLKSFAARLNDRMAPAVRIATPDMALERGQVLVAPGGQHHAALRGTTPPHITTPQDSGGDLHIPSVDRLFRSALPLADRVVAVLLTGMGRDGADAMAELRAAGAATLAQSADTCVVNGMPGAARRLGAAMADVPLDKMGDAILAHCGARLGERPR